MKSMKIISVDPPLILASKSPRRSEILNNAGIPFMVEGGNFDESLFPYESEKTNNPGEYACELARQKAFEVARKRTYGLVLGVDTIVHINGQVLGKPVDDKDALRMLLLLSGRWHEVISGMAIVNVLSGTVISCFETTRVLFKDMNYKEMEAYIRTGEPEGKAGAYAIQGIGALFVKKVEGCFLNVVGLPVDKLVSMIKEAGGLII